MITKIPKMDTRDNTRMSLYWVVEGTKPIPKQQKITDQDEMISKLEDNIIDHKQEIIALKKKNIDQEQKNIDQEKQIKELRQQNIVLEKGQPGQS